MTEDILAALPVRQGHFLLESGYHSDTWFTLDALFAEPASVAPLVAALADQIRPYAPAAVCGPLLGGAFLAHAIATALSSRFYYTELVPPTDMAAFNMFGAAYRLPPGLKELVPGESVAVVDDVISAGSSVRATVASLVEAGASTVVVASLMVLGDAGWTHFTEQGLPVETLQRRKFELWKPSDCPLCASGERLEKPQ